MRTANRLLLIGLIATCNWFGSWLAGQAPSSPRVGIQGPAAELSLREAVRLALENNPALRTSQQEVEARRFLLSSSKGVFDPHLEINSNLESETLPVGSLLSGGQAGKVATDRWINNARLSQNLFFGGDWALNFEADRTTTSSLFTQLDPQYPTFLGVDLRFPLLKNRSTDSRRLEIVIASRNIEVGEAELRQLALDLVTQVRIAYWSLALEREDQRVRADAVRLAREQVERNERLLAAGQASGVDVVEAEAAYQNRQGEWLASFEAITARENDLKQLILGSRGAELWSREIVPSDRQEDVDPNLNVSEAWEVARSHRPELRRLEVQSQVQEANSEFLQDQTRPTLDFFASYGMNGLAGQERSGGNPFTSQNAIFFERVNDLSGIHALETIDLPISGGVPVGLLGGWGRSFSNLFSNDFRTGSVGVRFDLPLGNREIKGELAASRVRERQLELERARIEQRIEGEIRNALQAVHTNQQRVEAARAAREAAQARLESEQRQFDAGETTNFLLLTRQSFFIEASARELRALVDLNISLANLQRVLGVALDAFGIRLEESNP